MSVVNINDYRQRNYARVVELLNIVDPFGPMHITVDDGNMDDGNLAFVEQEMNRCGATLQEHELLRLLRTLALEDRERAWDDANNQPDGA